ncbi:MAG TPA: glycosyltransferase [Gammaproteobacteria bacterium]|nr:glycosyltransferase [Gammaproteobacteria bacterium]
MIRLAAPTESARLLFAMPQYWNRVAAVLSEVVTEEEIPPVIVATHFFHLRLARRFSTAVWLYDAAEYFSLSLSAYFGTLSLLVRPFLYGMEGLGIRRMRAVLGVDSRLGWFERYLRRFNKRVKIVPNVPSREDDPTSEQVACFATEYAGRPVICYVGGIMERKGLEVTFAALKLLKRKVPDFLLLLIGTFVGESSQLEEELRTNEMEECVSVVNSLPYKDMIKRITAADVGLALYQRHPLYERVGKLNARKIFAYMQAGLCIIAPRFGEIGQAVPETDCGFLVDADNPADIAVALERLLLDDNLRARLKTNSRRAFEERYNWEAVARELKPWLLECCVGFSGREKS